MIRPVGSQSLRTLAGSVAVAVATILSLVLFAGSADAQAQNTVPQLGEPVSKVWPHDGTPLVVPGEIRSSQDGTDYDADPRLLTFDDSSWPVTAMLPDAQASSDRVGFYRSRENMPADGRGYYFRYEFELEDVYQITDMQLQVYYDDSVILFMNGQEIYRTVRNNFDSSPGANPSIYQTIDPINGGGEEEYYTRLPGTNNSCDPDECPDVTLDAIDPQNLVSNPNSDSPNALQEGTNVVMAMVWTTLRSTSGDLGFDFAMDVERDLNAPFPRPIVQPLTDQSDELADTVNLSVDGITENDPNSLTFSASGLPDGLSINASTGVISGNPTAMGNFNVTVTAEDNVGVSTIDFGWTIENAPPQISSPGPQQSPVLNSVSVPLSATDPDGGPVTLVVSGLPTGLSYSNGTISGTPSVEGPNSVEVRATDNENETVIIQFPWQIAEPPIDINNPGPQSSPYGQPVNLLLSATDPAGGTVGLSITSELPPGLSFNANNRIQGNPTELGDYTIVVEGTGPSGSAVISFTWTVENVRPSVNVPGPQLTLGEFTPLTVTASAIDPDGGPVSLAASNIPPGVSFDSLTGEFSGVATDAGTYDVQVTATDDESSSRTASFTWEVLPAVPNPIRINEVVASNDLSLLDEDQDSPDWFELVNTSGIPLNLNGWTIADSTNLWPFPDITLQPGEYLVVFASDKNRGVVGSPLHTDFKLSKEGDELTLSDNLDRLVDVQKPLPLAFTDVAVGFAQGTFSYLDTPTPGAANSSLGSNFEPILRPFSDRIYNVYEPVNEQLDAFDPDGTALNYVSETLPGVSLDSATGTFSGAVTVPFPSGLPRNVQVEDTDGMTASQTVTWTIIPAPSATPGLLLNEYNAVSKDLQLAGIADPAFADPVGNGGNWFEFVVVEDGLDLRGWTIELWDRSRGDDLLAKTDSLVFSDEPFLAHLPAGVIITVSETRPDDISLNPTAGDWHINFQSAVDVLDEDGDPLRDEEGEKIRDPQGAYFTADSQENFTSSRKGQAVIIRDATGANRTPVVGETDAWDAANGGVGSTEVMNLCIDPTNAQPSPTNDYADNGAYSTYGEPNTCFFTNDPFDPDDDTTVPQDLSALRNSAQLVLGTVSGDCVSGNGVVRVQLRNLDGVPVNAQVSIDGLAPKSVTVPGAGTEGTFFSGRADGLYTVEVDVNGDTFTLQQAVVCDGEATVSVTCVDQNGWVTVDVFNPTGQLAGYSAVIDGILKSRNVEGYTADLLRVTGRADGFYTFDVRRNATTVATLTAIVNCDPTVPAPPGVYPTVTCLAGNGRVDVNVVNTGGAAVYELTVGSLSPRSRLVAAGDWWRSPVTGRADGLLPVKLYRGGNLIMDVDLTVACDGANPQVTAPQVRTLNVCRNGDGFVAWQFSNPSPEARSYLVLFEGVPNRSTSAAGYGASVRGVSARPDGDYDVRILANGTEIVNETITVSCDP